MKRCSGAVLLTVIMMFLNIITVISNLYRELRSTIRVGVILQYFFPIFLLFVFKLNECYKNIIHKVFNIDHFTKEYFYMLTG